MVKAPKFHEKKRTPQDCDEKQIFEKKSWATSIFQKLNGGNANVTFLQNQSYRKQSQNLPRKTKLQNNFMNSYLAIFRIIHMQKSQFCGKKSCPTTKFQIFLRDFGLPAEGS